MIELMITISIIGILASIATVSYMDYTARTQMAEAVTLFSGLKAPIAEFYVNRGRWPKAIGSVGSPPSGKYVESLKFEDGSENAAVLTIIATMKSNGVSPYAKGKILHFVSSDAKLWECRFVDDAGGKYMPTHCTKAEAPPATP